jgi:hypothetical protein
MIVPMGTLLKKRLVEDVFLSNQVLLVLQTGGELWKIQ